MAEQAYAPQQLNRNPPTCFEKILVSEEEGKPWERESAQGRNGEDARCLNWGPQVTESKADPPSCPRRVCKLRCRQGYVEYRSIDQVCNFKEAR